MQDSNDVVIARWTLDFKGFLGDGVKHATIVSAVPWEQNPLTLYPQVSFNVTFKAGTPRSKAVLYALTLEAHEHAKDGNDDFSRGFKVFQRPVTTTTTPILHSATDKTLIGKLVRHSQVECSL
jgi:hypothetical protein